MPYCCRSRPAANGRPSPIVLDRNLMPMPSPLAPGSRRSIKGGLLQLLKGLKVTQSYIEAVQSPYF